jgi:hypothetical protein
MLCRKLPQAEQSQFGVCVAFIDARLHDRAYSHACVCMQVRGGGRLALPLVNELLKRIGPGVQTSSTVLLDSPRESVDVDTTTSARWRSPLLIRPWVDT